MKREPEKREPQEPGPVDEQGAEEQECSESQLEQVTGGVATREKGSSPGYGPGTSIDL